MRDGGVDFVVVGGIAAVLNGAPVNTFDLDIVHARDPENVAKLVLALSAMDAIYRSFLNVLETIGRSLTYEHLLPRTTEMEIGAGVRVKVLDLPMIITLKEQPGGEKDLAVLPILRRNLQQ